MPNTLGPDYLKNSVWKPHLFDGKVVFVTGGAGTICRVQTEALVLLGANAVILGRNPAKTEKAAKEIATLRPGAKVLGIGNCDVRNIENLTAAVDRTVKELGRIDFVIAGAAGNFLSPFTSLSSNAFRTVTEIDLIGAFNTAKATYDQLREHKGHIIFVSATLHYKGLPFQSHAAAAKAGIDSLTKTLAVELGPMGIQSNGIAPGPIEGTEGFDRLVPEDIRQRSLELIPLGRLGKTVEIADATVYLFSPAASYVTGQILVVDGAEWQSTSGAMNYYPHSVIATGSQDNKL